MNAEERYRLQKQAERKKNDGRKQALKQSYKKSCVCCERQFQSILDAYFSKFSGVGACPQTPLLFLTHFSNYNLTGLITIFL